MAEIRRREVEKTPSKPQLVDDNLLQPDYVLVFGATKDTKPQRTANVRKAVTALRNAGFYVSTRRGAGDSVLLLVRAEPSVLSGDHGRASVVYQRLPLKQLEGITDKFVVNDSNRRTLGGTALTLSESTLDAIEQRYGGHVAGVFEFANFFILWLALLALLGVGAQYFLGRYSYVFTGITLVWGALFVAKWRNAIQPDGLQSRRGLPIPTANGPVFGTRRASFAGTLPEVRERRRLLFVPVVALLMSVYALGLFAIFAFEIAATQFYAGPGKKIVGLMPVGANVVASNIYSMIYSHIVDRFSEWEDYPTEEELIETKAQRSFYLEALIGYLPIVLTTYIYLPFGDKFVELLAMLHRSKASNFVTLNKSFKLNHARLLSQTTFYTAQQQLLAMIFKVILPLTITWFKQNVLHRTSWAKNNRFAVEQLRPQYSTAQQMSALVLSFGYVLLLAPVWPLAALFTLVGLWLRTRGSLYMLTRGTRKPATFSPVHGRDISFWSGNLQGLVGLASVVTPALAVMYGPIYRQSQIHGLGNHLSIPWFFVSTVSLFSENIVLALIHVSSLFYRSTGLEHAAKEKARQQFVIKKMSESSTEQDQLWQGIDATAELREVFGDA